MKIDSLEGLKALYGTPGERALRKQLPSLDAHCRRFIALSPFVVLATSDASGSMDASPRGGAPGFVKVHASGDLLLPDASGNNRLDSLQNIVVHGQAGLLFLIPGFDETLRVNGPATLTTDPALLEECREGSRAPVLAIRVQVREAYLHCAKAFMRSRLWEAGAQVPRSVLPSLGQMIHDQAGITAPAESQEQMLARYRQSLQEEGRDHGA